MNKFIFLPIILICLFIIFDKVLYAADCGGESQPCCYSIGTFSSGTCNNGLKCLEGSCNLPILEDASLSKTEKECRESPNFKDWVTAETGFSNNDYSKATCYYKDNTYQVYFYPKNINTKQDDTKIKDGFAAGPITKTSDIEPAPQYDNKGSSSSFKISELSDSISTKYGNLGNVISIVFKYFLAIAGVVLFLLILFSGFNLLTSAGNQEKIEKGQKTLTSAIIGFIIIFVSFWLMQIIQYIGGLNLGF
ncbi:hypothetical protein GYA19_01490 [Candidatus Beckwithbacteria bacterium]|nr:hypothetical protein [Candidatus Beckwithbacteria bacterium]